MECAAPAGRKTQATSHHASIFPVLKYTAQKTWVCFPRGVDSLAGSISSHLYGLIPTSFANCFARLWNLAEFLVVLRI